MKTTIENYKSTSVFSRKYISEIFHYKDLLTALVKRDINVVYKQTILGFAWAIIRPLIQMILFTIIFGYLAKIGNDIQGVPYALFSFIALVPWTYFSTSMTASTTSLVNSEQFLTKIYFPRIIIPITPILAKLLDFFISLIIVFLMMIYYKMPLTINLIYLPVLIIIMMVFALGISLWLSAIAIQYRDVNQLIQFLSQILMYVTPVIWPISYIPEKYQFIYGFHPMAGVIEGFRAAFITNYEMPWMMLLTGSVTTIIIFLSGLKYFRSKEDIFADVI